MLRGLTAALLLLLMFVAPAVSAEPGKGDPDSLASAATDTLSASGIAPGKLLFKERLDSIQQSVPLVYNEHVQKYIDIYTARPAQIGRMLGLSGYYFPIYEKALKAYNIPEEIKFISIVESALNPYAVSRVGATGLWQFMPATAKDYGLTMDSYVDERRDPQSASDAAAHYFQNSFEEFGDWLLAIAAYNCGSRSVNRAIARAGGSKDFWAIRPYLPSETRNYVPAFIATAYVMKYFSSHNISTIAADFPEATDIIQVDRFVSLAGIAKAAGIDFEKLCLLNPSYKRQVINGSPQAPKTLVLPQLDKGAYSAVYETLNDPGESKILLAKAKAAAWHKVRSGENLSVIANRYRVRVQDLKAWNKLKSLLIHPGQMLRVSLL